MLLHYNNVTYKLRLIFLQKCFLGQLLVFINDLMFFDNMLGICVLRNCFGVIFSKLTLDYVNFYQNLEFQNKLFSSIQYLLTCIDRKQRILTKYLKIFFFTLKPSLPSPQVKWSYLIINRNWMWELSHEFPNNLRLIEILGNKKKN